jgi:hypothetical protein
MFYRLKALAPCTVFVSGKSYRVEAGDPLYISKTDADQILSGPYRSRFVVIAIEDEPAPFVEELDLQALTSKGTVHLVPSSQEHELHAPVIDSSDNVGLHAPGTVVDPIQDVYESYKKDGEGFLEKVAPTEKDEDEVPKPLTKRAKAPKPVVQKVTPVSE